MTTVQIATGIINNLHEENRVILDALNKAQDTIKYSERQLAEKDSVIKALEERIRAGTDGLLEMTNRQKELTIQHLEMQIKKLLKENEDLEAAVKAEICPKCETKLLLNENREYADLSKSCKPPGKSSSALLGKKYSEMIWPKRVKTLEMILEHKNGRINHLSNEVKRLTKTEKDLTQKMYQLTKLLPMSRLPPSKIKDCLLQKNQQLKSQKKCSDDTCLQNRLKKSSLVEEYENENKTLKENLEKLKTQIKQQDGAHHYQKKSSEKLFTSFSDSKCTFNRNDAKKLQEIIMIKEAQLEDAERHINNYENCIKELQKILKNPIFDHPKIQLSPSRTDDITLDSAFEQENKVLQTNLNVAEKNIKEYETVMKQFQNTVRQLEEENQEQLDKIKSLEKRETLSETLSHEKMRLQSKLDVAQKYIDTLEKNIETLLTKLKITEKIKIIFETELREEIERNNERIESELQIKSSDFSTTEKVLQVESIRPEHAMTASQLKSVQEELAGTKSVTNFLLSSCSRLEQLVDKEKTDRIGCVKELELCRETIKNLTEQLNSKKQMTKRLDALIDILRSKDFNDEMTLEQLKKEIQWLADKATASESELYVYKEENCKMKSDILKFYEKKPHE